MKTKYELSWDKYSKDWGKKGIDGKALGVEWGSDSLTQDIHEKFLAPHLSTSATALEIGPGGGKYSFLVAPICKKLICADVSQEMLNRTRRRLGEGGNLETVKLNGLDFSGIADDSVDFAFSIDVFVHLDLEDIYCYLREFWRVLRAGGSLVLHFANLLSFHGWTQFLHEADINRAQFKQIGRIGFISPDIARRMLEGVGFLVENIDTVVSVRDFIIVAQKPALPAANDNIARNERILSGLGGTVHCDLISALPAAIRSAPDERYIAPTSFDLEGDVREVIFAHPPSFIGYPFTVPRNAVLRTAAGVNGNVWEKCCPQGIGFRILLREGTNEHVLYSRDIDPANKKEDRKWHDVQVDLDRFTGKVVFLIFETGIGGGANEFNWCGWAEPALIVP